MIAEFTRKAYAVARSWVDTGDWAVDAETYDARVRECVDCPSLRGDDLERPEAPDEAFVAAEGRCGFCECPIRRLAIFKAENLCELARWPE